MKGEYQSTVPTVLTEQRRPATEPRASHIGVVFLAAFGSFLVVLLAGSALALIISIVIGYWSAVAIGSIIVGLIVMAAVWFYGLWEYKERVVWATEKTFGVDINRDGRVGEPPAERYFPVFNYRLPAVEAPEPQPRVEGDKLVELTPSQRTIQKHKLWTYLLQAYRSGDWTRDGGTRLASPINQKEWADVKKFIEHCWPDVWGTDQRPALLKCLRSLGYPGPNGTEPNERNG